MTDQVLDVLKIGLLCLLYLFFVRVLWTVWTEVRTAASNPSAGQMNAARSSASAAAPPRSATPQRPPQAVAPAKLVPTRLTIIEPADRFGTTYQIGNAIPIGRDAESGVKISDDSFVSGKHARVSLIAGQVYVDDVGSRNGTYVNGTRISSQTPLYAGDRVQVGYTVLEAG